MKRSNDMYRTSYNYGAGHYGNFVQSKKYEPKDNMKTRNRNMRHQFSDFETTNQKNFTNRENKAKEFNSHVREYITRPEIDERKKIHAKVGEIRPLKSTNSDLISRETIFHDEGALRSHKENTEELKKEYAGLLETAQKKEFNYSILTHKTSHQMLHPTVKNTYAAEERVQFKDEQSRGGGKEKTAKNTSSILTKEDTKPKFLYLNTSEPGKLVSTTKDSYIIPQEHMKKRFEIKEKGPERDDRFVTSYNQHYLTKKIESEDEEYTQRRFRRKKML